MIGSSNFYRNYSNITHVKIGIKKNKNLCVLEPLRQKKRKEKKNEKHTQQINQSRNALERRG